MLVTQREEAGVGGFLLQCCPPLHSSSPLWGKPSGTLLRIPEDALANSSALEGELEVCVWGSFLT